MTPSSAARPRSASHAWRRAEVRSSRGRGGSGRPWRERPARRSSRAPPALSSRAAARRDVPSRRRADRRRGRRPGLGRELADAALRRMDALQQVVEGERAVDGDDDLAIEDRTSAREAPSSPRRSRESSARAAGPLATCSSTARRRGTRGSGTRPTSARRPTRGPSGISGTSSASIGSSDDGIGSVTAASPAGSGPRTAAAASRGRPAPACGPGRCRCGSLRSGRRRSTSSQVTGVDTVARGVGRTE